MATVHKTIADKMTHGSLFSGIGGFDLAAEWMGWENIFHCELAEFPSKVLKHYWPNTEHYADITKTDFTKWRGKVDVLSGGFPCQPFSQAGKRKGTADTRYLWPEMLRVIREVRPRWIVGENVYGLVNWDGGVVLDTVCAELANEGFKVLPVVLPAASINAPHKRQRIFFIAYRNGTRLQEARSEQQTAGVKQYGELGRASKNTDGDGCSHNQRKSQSGEREQWNTGAGDNEWVRTNDGKIGATADTSNEGLQRSENNRGIGGSGAQSHELTTGLLRTNWQEFPTQSPVCSRDDGLSSRLDGITFPKWRSESIKGYGNAVVPPLVLEIFKTIELYEMIYG